MSDSPAPPTPHQQLSQLENDVEVLLYHMTEELVSCVLDECKETKGFSKTAKMEEKRSEIADSLSDSIVEMMQLINGCFDSLGAEIEMDKIASVLGMVGDNLSL
ncbi:hypothetical protein GLAREA_04137 [Glarea lozoyensis ATCC 20868]|uniref:Uncharacterized protein n=1 Tax=Glarea lozoyensis (strain ATCC 20868 / MF5171) TaxID=1116229 RepID=S3CZY8_GLAL2|nr:uncharacterized protein GLAREA_04137 [Glarea lozoyensis ATCC 20868]EPE31170.1 hypothetical protein GLAREA_04137 [Glarea lozoyensis ATCC 20868]